MPIVVQWAAATHAGAVRTVNQDAVLRGPDIFAVADGMGGHAAGEVASALAIAQLAQVETRPTVQEVVSAVEGANAGILAAAAVGSGREGMGTTVAGVALGEADDVDALIVFNVGDSRVYAFDGHQLRQVTVDHSVVAEMVTAGEISSAAARSHTSRNVITRALGIAHAVEVDHWTLWPEAGYRFLICSDGLTNEISDAVIEAVLTHQSDPQLVVDSLLHSALESGARDNVSLVLIDIERLVDGFGPLDEDTNPGVNGTVNSASDAGEGAAEGPVPSTGIGGNTGLITGVPYGLEVGGATGG